MAGKDFSQLIEAGIPVPGTIYTRVAPPGVEEQYVTVLAVDILAGGRWTALVCSVSHGIFRVSESSEEFNRKHVLVGRVGAEEADDSQGIVDMLAG